MGPTMILYASMSSSELKAIRFYIEVNNLKCCFCDLDTGNKEETAKNLLRKNPSGIFPFLEDSNVFVAGSLPVLLYLAERYAKFAFFGKSLDARAKVEATTFWALNALERSVYYDFAAPRLYENHSIGEFEDICLVSHGKSEIINHFNTLEKSYLANNNCKFLIGNELTMADIFVSVIITPLESVLFDFTPWPGLCRWFESIKAEISRVSQKSRLSKMTSFNIVKSK